MHRRDFLKHSATTASLLALTGCAARRPVATATALPFYDAVPPLTPIRAHADRLFRITVCLRPFRAAVPRLDTDRVAPIPCEARHPQLRPHLQRRRLLINDFQIPGGRIETAEFRTPADLVPVPQKIIINCTGYGARALWSDESIVPVRGQIGWLIPQEGVHYGFYYKDIGVLARRDGIVVQGNIYDDMYGYNNSDETPNRAESETAVQTLLELNNRMTARKNFDLASSFQTAVMLSERPSF